MRAHLLAVLAWSSLVVANFSDVEVSPGNGDSGISFYGNWKTVSDDCGPAFVASAVGDALAYSFQGAAVYVLGTVSCGWQGLLNISVDGIFNTTIDRCNCDVAGASGRICRFPWLAKDGLDPSVEHTLSLTLIGPTAQQNSSAQVIAELRSIRYSAPMQSTDSTDDDGSPDDSTPSTLTAMNALPSTSAESADAPLPQLANLHLSTAATAGIIVSVVLFFLFALFLCIYLRRRSQQRRKLQNGGPAMASRPGSLRYPTEHLAWSPAAERLEARAQQQAAAAAAGRRSGSGGSSWGSRSSQRRRMDSIPEAPDDHHHPSISGALAAAAAAEGSRRAEERSRSFSWSDGSSPGSSPEEGLLGEKSDSEKMVYSAVARRPPPPPPPRLAFPSAAASGDYWNRRTSRGSGRYSAPQSPLRKSLVPGDEESASAS